MGRLDSGLAELLHRTALQRPDWLHDPRGLPEPGLRDPGLPRAPPIPGALRLPACAHHHGRAERTLAQGVREDRRGADGNRGYAPMDLPARAGPAPYLPI